MCWPNIVHASESTNCNFNMSSQKPTQCQKGLNMLTNHVPCQRGNKSDLNLCWINPVHACKQSKCISINIDYTLRTLESKQNLSQRLTILISCQRGRKCISSYVKKTFPKTASTQIVSQPMMNKHIHASEDTKYISKSVETTRAQNASQPVLNKIPLMPQRWQYVNMCRLNPSHDSED